MKDTDIKELKSYVEKTRVHDGYTSYSVSANYTFSDNDKIKTLYGTTAASDITITLPTAAANTDRVIEIWKVDSGAGNVVVDGEGAETIQGLTTVTLYSQYEGICIKCTGTAWLVMNVYHRTITNVCARLTSDQDIPSGSGTPINFDSEDYDELGEFNTGTYTFTPLIAGYYHIDLIVKFTESLNDGNVYICNVLKGVFNIAGNWHYIGNAGAPQIGCSIDTHLAITEGIRGQIYHNFGANRLIDATYTYLTIHRIYNGGL